MSFIPNPEQTLAQGGDKSSIFSKKAARKLQLAGDSLLHMKNQDDERQNITCQLRVDSE